MQPRRSTGHFDRPITIAHMSIVDKILVVEEYANALLQRLADFKQALDNESLQPPVFRKLNQVQALPLNKGVELELSAPNVCLKPLSLHFQSLYCFFIHYHIHN